MLNKYVIHKGELVKVYNIMDDYVYYHSKNSLMIKEHKMFFKDKEIVKNYTDFYYIGKDVEEQVRHILDKFMKKYRPYIYTITINRIYISNENDDSVMPFLFNPYEFFILKDYRRLIFNQIETLINALIEVEE